MKLIRFTMALLVTALLIVGVGCNAGVRTYEPIEGPVDNTPLSTVVPPDTNDIPEDEPEPDPESVYVLEPWPDSMPVFMLWPNLEPEVIWPITSYHNGNWNPDNFTALDRPHDRDIYIMNGDGSEAVNLTKDITTNYFLADRPSEIAYMMFTYPQWSLDGSKILFSGSASYEPTYWDGINVWNNDSSGGYHHEVADSGYYVMDSDGSNITRILDWGYDRVFWSPDGKITIVYVDKDYVTKELTEAIMVMDSDGANLTELFFEVTFDGREYNSLGQVYWSPDGSKLAFKRDDYLYTLNKDGSDLRVLDNNVDKYIATYSWSPDGSKIGYCKDWGFYIMNADGSDSIAVYNTDRTLSRAYSCGWSPDGTVAWYHVNGNRNYFAYADGSPYLSLAYLDDGFPVWLPDGSITTGDQPQDSYVTANITHNPAGEGTTVRKYYWSPDNSKILADIENQNTFDILTSE